MRRTAYRCVSVLLGVFACSSGSDDDDGGGATGGASSGAAGRGVIAGAPGTSGSSGAGGSSAGSGATAGTSGARNTGGAAGVSGGTGGQGGAAAGLGAGTAGGASGGAGAANQAGTGGQGGGGRGGSTSEAGVGGDDANGAAGASGAPNEPVGLSWPIDCIPGESCVNLDYPDIDGDGEAHDCGAPGYVGHEGTDIGITFDAQAAGTAVRAAADGVVLFAFDGKYDQCPDANEPDCRNPPGYDAGAMTGTTVCTPVGNYCGTGQPGCYWCFAGGNVIVIRHDGVPGVFATRYDHLKKDSVLVQPGAAVARGQKIAEAASAGNSTGPHLHFEVWGTGFYELADPWAGACGPNTGPSLWAYDPPWSD